MATLVLMDGGDDGTSMALSGAHWFLLQSQKGEASARALPFWDEHSFDKQRFYSILCLIYGANPDKRVFLTSLPRVIEHEIASRRTSKGTQNLPSRFHLTGMGDARPRSL